MKKLNQFIPALLLFLLYSSIACAQAPVISMFSPVAAGAGSSVTITGQNFSTDKNNNIVWFGKARAIVNSASATQLIVQVPQTSDYGPISLLNLSSGLKAVSTQFFDGTFKIKNKMTASNFEQNSLMSTADQYVRIDYGDIDGDGKTDLVRINGDKNTVSINLNVATGRQLNVSSFAPEVILPCQNEPLLILVSDMDNDGRNDIVVGSSYGLTIFINNFTPGNTLTSASFRRVDLPFTADKMAVGDFDGDGKPDLAITHNADGQLILLKNNMAGGILDASSFTQAAVLPFDGSELHVTDMDGDGKPDIFYPSGDGILFLHNNVGAEGITAQAFNGNILDLPQGTGMIAIADLDGDHKPDLLFTGNNNDLYAYKNISQPGSLDNSSFQSQGQAATGAQPIAIATGDFDGDGKPDVAVIDNGDQILNIFHNIYNAAAPAGAWLERIKYALPISPYTIRVTDLNGDGYPDLMITKSNKAGILLIKNEPADIPVINSFSPAMAASGSTVTIKGENFTENPSNVNVYFGDRRAKIISLTDSVVKAAVPDGTSYARISLLVKPAKRTAVSAQTFRGTYLNKANITNSDFKLSLQITLGQYMQDIRFADFDGDGFPDLIYIDNASKQITIQKNRGQQVPIDCGLFTTVCNLPNNIAGSSLQLCDINGDGRQDIIVTSENETGYYLNTSAGGIISFSPYKQLFTSTIILNNSVLSTEDLDRDGRPDFTSNLQIYRNTLTENDQSPGVNDPFEPNSDVYPVIVTFADADGDGKVDMFSYEGGSAGMSVRQNVSAPGYLDGFSFGQVQATGIPSQLLRMKDLDNDGKPDVISNDKLFKNVSTGPGNFAYTQEGAFPEADFLQDVNGDGLADYGNSSGPYLTTQHRLFIHQNRATAPQMPVYTDEITLGYDDVDPAFDEYNPEFVAVEDLNNDNKPEMVYYDPDKYQLFFFENVSVPADNDPAPQITSVSQQAGQINSKVSISGKNFGPVAGNNYVYFGGVQGRVISGNSTMLNVQVPPGAMTATVNVINSITKLNTLSDQPYKLIYGAGAPQSFTANSFKTLGDLADNVPGNEFRLADLNNDGKYELVVLGGGQLTIYNSTATDAYGNPAGFVKALSYAIDGFRLSIADLNGDNRPEILVMTGSNVTVFENNSNSECGLSFLPQPATPTGGNFTVGDMDGDGKPDIIVSSVNGIDGYLNTSKRGSISFGPYQNFHIAAANNQDASRAIYLVDFDGDGKKDIIYMLSNGNDQLVLIRNLGRPPGSPPAFAAPVFINTSSAYGLAVSDVDGDGKPDIILVTVQPNAVQVYRNVAVPGSISAASLSPPLSLGIAAEYNSIATADFDGDGKPDILLGDSYDPSISLLHNTASPGTIDKSSFEDPVQYAIGTNDSPVCLDLNRDGRTDILLHMGSSFKFLQNDSGNPGLELFINGETKHYIVHAQAVFIDSLLQMDNNTGTPVTSATVSISENYDPNKDLLSFSTGNAADGNITASFSADDGTLTLNSAGATASVAQWQQALESVMFSSSTADTSARLITVNVHAGAIASLPVSRLFTLQIVPQPDVVSFTPSLAPAGTTVTISGTGFTAVTGVSFGGTPASSFIVNSATLITAVVAAGSSGTVNVSNAVGSSSQDGFTFIGVPAINPGGPVELKTGESVLLQTPAVSGLSYQWSKDGADISGATGASYTVTDAGYYTLSVLYGKGLRVTSDPVTVSVTFTLPADNFLVSSTSATCRGVSDGSVNITAKQSMPYVLTLTGAAMNAYPFTTMEQVNGLAAGTYQACITVPSQPSYQQCFSLVVGQPAELSVYTTVNNFDKTITLKMSGSSQYTIILNNRTYVSTQDTLSLPLSAGNNEVYVSTEKSCQGVFVKNIILNAAITPYPNPVHGTLTVDMGEDQSAVANVTVINRSGKEVYSSKLTVQSKKLYVDFSNFLQGLYVLSVKTDSSASVYKILKK